MKEKDSLGLGTRMKVYEYVTRFFLFRRSYTIIRVDGKAFHSYTKGLLKPYDEAFMEDMDKCAAYLCKNIMGAKLAYVQSDEISLVLTDFEKIQSDAWFANNLQKMCSISASMATRAFNEARLERFRHLDKWAEFDSRVFQIPMKEEVFNYFIWRQQDATKNSIQSAARTYFSNKDVYQKNGDQMQEMLFSQKGINWNSYPEAFKRGRVIVKENYELNGAIRSKWISKAPPIFTQDREFLNNLIPNNF